MTNGFMLNGSHIALHDDDPRQSLLRWLNRHRYAGTKEGCADGDCGACTVALAVHDGDGSARWQAVNSCLMPMGSIVGREVLTVEALADGDELHPVQQAMVDCAGSQCGYCTPGFVMSLFVAHGNGDSGDETIEGNLCRCTGYRPIRDVAAALPQLAAGPPRLQPVGAAAKAASLGDFFSPESVADALRLKHQHPDADWICGATDLGVELGRTRARASRFIALDRIAELQTLQIEADHVRIGAALSLSRIERSLHGIFPALDQMLPWFAARQVRNRASFGGNLGSASPIGDLLPLLLALDGRIHLRGPDGPREIDADDFFTDYRRTLRSTDEIIVAVSLPRHGHGVQAAYKVAKRQTDDISIVAAAFALARDADGVITRARLAFGGVAAIPLRAKAVETQLIGKTLNVQTVAAVSAALQAAFTPLADHRASADYRRALCGALFERFVEEHCA